MNNDNNLNTKNIALTENGYEEISYTCSYYNFSYEPSYANSTLNFFGVSSGLVYSNLDTNTFETY